MERELSTQEGRRGLTPAQIVDLNADPEVVAGQKAAFLDALAQEGTVKHACDIAGIPKSMVYRWRAVDPEFARDWQTAMDDACDMVENSLYKQAVNGTDYVPKIVYLKAHRAKYRDKLTIDVNELDRDIERGLRELLDAARRGEIEVAGADSSPAELIAPVSRQISE